jgi:predicted GNAT family acetyltransferase
VKPNEYRAFTGELTGRLRADERAIGLVAVGSMADRDYEPDEWSDHDFFVITPAGGQEELRNDLSWLPRDDRVALSVRETDHGLIVIYDDGHLLEFAVFDLEEIALAGVNRYRVLLDRGGVEERVEHVAATPRPQRDDAFLFGKTVTAALVATGRARRGETLSAAFLVTWATTYLNRLLIRTIPAANASLLDGFDSLRRFERAYPELGAELAAIVRLDPADGGPAVLDLLERELRPLRPDLAWPAVDAVRVSDNPSELRYELFVDGELAGLIRYRRSPGALALVHTEVEPRFEGRGLAARLVAGALADIRARGLQIVPICPYVREYLERHPEDRDLIVADTEMPD